MQEFEDQLSSFIDGVAWCYLLNATCVLPRWYSDGSKSDPDARDLQFDPGWDQAVRMDHLYEEEAFISRMEGMLTSIMHCCWRSAMTALL